MAATERDLSRIVAHVRRRYAPLRRKAEIGLAVGAVINRHKMGKHYELTITDDSFTYRRKPESIAREARLDGLYVVRTSVPAETLSADEVVRAYKDLARVERAFRSLKSIDLQIRPVHHWVEPRVRAHVFLCMLAYYVEWHLRETWGPILFHDHERAEAEKERASPVAALEVSAAAKRKCGSRRSDDGLPITSFGDLMRHLATMTLNVVASPQAPSAAISLFASPTPLQNKAFALLGTALPRVQ
jgi:hypothetical protein